jgi:hypothetical protein
MAESVTGADQGHDVIAILLTLGLNALAPMAIVIPDPPMSRVAPLLGSSFAWRAVDRYGLD